MKRPFTSVIAAVAVASTFGVAVADDAHHTANAPKTQAQSAAPATGSQTQQMDQHMKEMQAIHERMMKATTPEERQKAMEDARKAMHGGMSMMNQTMGRSDKPMSSPGMSGGSNSQMQMMQKRMDMMQMMMQMMMDQHDGSHAGDMAPKK
jgi:hypothetical protein